MFDSALRPNSLQAEEHSFVREERTVVGKELSKAKAELETVYGVLNKSKKAAFVLRQRCSELELLCGQLQEDKRAQKRAFEAEQRDTNHKHAARTSYLASQVAWLQQELDQQQESNASEVIELESKHAVATAEQQKTIDTMRREISHATEDCRRQEHMDTITKLKSECANQVAEAQGVSAQQRAAHEVELIKLRKRVAGLTEHLAMARIARSVIEHRLPKQLDKQMQNERKQYEQQLDKAKRALKDERMAGRGRLQYAEEQLSLMKSQHTQELTALSADHQREIAVLHSQLDEKDRA